MAEQTPMKRTSLFAGTLLTVLMIAVPAFALEDGIVETSRYSPNEDLTHADFERVITNVSEDHIDVAPRDLRMAEYPIMTVTEITAGTFAGGVWTVGTLDAGQTATITYTGDAAPTATSTSPEELPHTGQQDHLVVFVFAGLALIGLGAALLRATRD